MVCFQWPDMLEEDIDSVNYEEVLIRLGDEHAGGIGLFNSLCGIDSLQGWMVETTSAANQHVPLTKHELVTHRQTGLFLLSRLFACCRKLQTMLLCLCSGVLFARTSSSHYP